MVKFPEDFDLKDETQELFKNLSTEYGYEKFHWTYPKRPEGVLEKDHKVVISIIGGTGCYGDGYSTFEMFDFREDDVQGHLNVWEINEHLKNHPLDI